jgi:hypothetical protein
VAGNVPGSLYNFAVPACAGFAPHYTVKVRRFRRQYYVNFFVYSLALSQFTISPLDQAVEHRSNRNAGIALLFDLFQALFSAIFCARFFAVLTQHVRAGQKGNMNND